MKRYEVIDHTADIGLRAYGKNIEELFVNAAFGMFDIITELEKVAPAIFVEIQVEASGWEELLVAWLRELLFRYHSEEILFKDFEIEKLSKAQMKAKAGGEKIVAEKHELKTEIKAVTYHELKVERVGSEWVAQVIFDV